MLLLSNGPDQILKINLNNFVLFKDVSFVLFSQIVQVKTGLDFFLHCRHRDKKKKPKRSEPWALSYVTIKLPCLPPFRHSQPDSAR